MRRSLSIIALSDFLLTSPYEHNSIAVTNLQGAYLLVLRRRFLYSHTLALTPATPSAVPLNLATTLSPNLKGSCPMARILVKRTEEKEQVSTMCLECADSRTLKNPSSSGTKGWRHNVPGLCLQNTLFPFSLFLLSMLFAPSCISRGGWGYTSTPSSCSLVVGLGLVDCRISAPSTKSTFKSASTRIY